MYSCQHGRDAFLTQPLGDSSESSRVKLHFSRLEERRDLKPRGGQGRTAGARAAQGVRTPTLRMEVGTGPMKLIVCHRQTCESTQPPSAARPLANGTFPSKSPSSLRKSDLHLLPHNRMFLKSRPVDTVAQPL